MKIVDAQIHLWSTGLPSHPHRQITAWGIDEALAAMDEAGVDAAVIHPPLSWDPHANALAEQAASLHPRRFAVLGQVPIDRPESRGLLADWRSRPGQCGLRWPLLRPDQQTWHIDGTMDWVWAEAERVGLPVATMAGRFLKDFGEIARRHPRLRLIVDHLGLVREGRDEAAFAKLPDLLALAALPNVAVKATGAPGYATEPYPFPRLAEGLHRIFDAFGPKRFFWGTDITRMPCTWRQCVTHFTEELPWLAGGDDLEWVMGRGVCEWIGWKGLET
ncbi:MAG: amidohydrolase family protein [Betaproteobacteria bacterium]|jgi:predicted TIM-barrel fold metal-dependent hydrolase|nr:amidohydrolase family protein [Betaproteobacteria bacterium]